MKLKAIKTRLLTGWKDVVYYQPSPGRFLYFKTTDGDLYYGYYFLSLDRFVFFKNHQMRLTLPVKKVNDTETPFVYTKMSSGKIVTHWKYANKKSFIFVLWRKIKRLYLFLRAFAKQ